MSLHSPETVQIGSEFNRELYYFLLDRSDRILKKNFEISKGVVIELIEHIQAKCRVNPRVNVPVETINTITKKYIASSSSQDLIDQCADAINRELGKISPEQLAVLPALFRRVKDSAERTFSNLGNFFP